MRKTTAIATKMGEFDMILATRHTGIVVRDIEAAWKRLTEAGCDVLSAPVTAPDGKARLFFARDPEGNLMELVQMLT